MFIETHTDKITTKSGDEITLPLTFIKSRNIQVYPCGRRRSEVIDKDGSNLTQNDKYYFPFDPEARLNTEANNRKHSSLNGFTQTYIKDFEEGVYFTLALNGYLFKIKLDAVDTAGSVSSPHTFGFYVIETIKAKLTAEKAAAIKVGDSALAAAFQAEIEAIDKKTRIYANISLEDVQLFTGFQDYYTSILRNQSDGIPDTSLDLLIESRHDDLAASKSSENYYFSGLSFSTVPLAIRAADDNVAFNKILSSSETRYSEPYTFNRNLNTSTVVTVNQQLVSLCILEKDTNDNYTWKIHQPALLPKIEHGTTKDSIVIYGDTTLKGTGKKLKVEGIAEICGDTALESNLFVEDNINVGALTDAEKATDINGGYIVAKNNITAKQNLTAGNDLIVTHAATIKNSLVVGERTDTDSSEAGTITAKTHIETPTLNASTSITTPTVNISDTLNVTNEGNATANIDKANITKELKVQKALDSDTNAKITADTAEITYDIIVKGTINAEGTLTGGVSNLVVTKADIETADINTLTGTSAAIEDITGTSTISSPTMYQDGYKVPIIELSQSGDFWQLKISRIGEKPTT